MATDEFCVFYDYAGKDACNTGFVIHQALTLADFQDVADALWENWCAQIMPNLVNTISTTALVLKDVDGPWETNGATAVSKVGGIVTPGLPPNCAVAINRTDSISRYKGRWFVPGISEGSVGNDGEVSATFGANLASQFTLVNTNMFSFSSAQIANRHAVSGLPGQYVYVSVDSFSYIPYVTSQRNRRF